MPVSESSRTDWFVGATRRMSRSELAPCVRPVTVSVIFVTVPVLPLTVTGMPYGVAGCGAQQSPIEIGLVLAGGAADAVGTRASAATSAIIATYPGSRRLL